MSYLETVTSAAFIRECSMKSRPSLSSLTFVLYAACLTCLLAVTGCGSGIATVPATGTVVHQGKPLKGATVTFSRGKRAITAGEIAIGETDAEGRFTLTTYIGPQADVKGAVIGKYDVTVSKYIIPPGMSESQYRALVAEVDRISASGAMMPPDQQLPDLVEMLPAQYSASGRSELSAEVTAKGPNDFRFELQ